MIKLILLGMFIGITSCTKDPAPPASTPYVRTNTTISSLTRTSAVCGGEAVSSYGSEIKQKGVCWSTFSPPTINNSYTSNGPGLGMFSSQLSGLSPNRTYYIRAYAINDIGISYGLITSFTTPN